MTDIQSRVAKGAALLDEKRTGWYRDINLETLDQDNGHSCVLGQLYGYWGTGLHKLMPDVPFLDMDHIKLSDEHGFGRDEDFPGLTSEWIRVIEERYVELPERAESEPESADEFIKRWGAELEKMYVNRTAGDHSFTGFVVVLLQDLKTKGVRLG